MSDRYFLDTNIIVYAHDKVRLEHQKISQDLIFNGIKKECGAVSTQVLCEFFVTITKKVVKPLSIKKALKEIELMRTLYVIEIDFDMITEAIRIHESFMISYWDSLIVTAANRAKCKILYTEDPNPGQSINGVEIVNPFI